MDESKDEQLESQFSFFPNISLRPAGYGHESNNIKYSKKTSAVISHDNGDDTSTIDENYEIQSLDSSVEDRLSFRGRLQVFIHSLPVQIFILSLVVLDAFAVLFELLLDVGAFNNRECFGANKIEQADFCHYDTTFRPNCPPSSLVLNKNENLTAGNGKDYCVCAYKSVKYTCAIAIDGEVDSEVNPGIVLHFLSLAILSVFLLEICLKLFAFRLKYFTHKFEVFDGIVVLVAWILDVSSTSREEAFFQLSALIIILRLWRVVRIVNGGVLSTKTSSDKKLQEARAHARNIVHALHKAQKRLKLQEGNINTLTELLTENDIPLPKLQTDSEIADTPEYPYDEEEGINFGSRLQLQ